MQMTRAGAKGFSLIELIVVVAIIALLLSIAVPRYQTSVERAEFVALVSNLRVLRHGIDSFHDDKGRYPGDLEELVQGRYLREMPTDPITRSKQTWLAIRGGGPGQEGIVDVRSGAKGMAFNGVPYADLTP